MTSIEKYSESTIASAIKLVASYDKDGKDGLALVLPYLDKEQKRRLIAAYEWRKPLRIDRFENMIKQEQTQSSMSHYTRPKTFSSYYPALLPETDPEAYVVPEHSNPLLSDLYRSIDGNFVESSAGNTELEIRNFYVKQNQFTNKDIVDLVNADIRRMLGTMIERNKKLETLVLGTYSSFGNPRPANLVAIPQAVYHIKQGLDTAEGKLNRLKSAPVSESHKRGDEILAKVKSLTSTSVVSDDTVDSMKTLIGDQAMTIETLRGLLVDVMEVLDTRSTGFFDAYDTLRLIKDRVPAQTYSQILGKEKAPNL